MDDISTVESTLFIGLYANIFALEDLFMPFEAPEFVAAEWIEEQ